MAVVLLMTCRKQWLVAFPAAFIMFFLLLLWLLLLLLLLLCVLGI